MQNVAKLIHQYETTTKKDTKSLNEIAATANIRTVHVCGILSYLGGHLQSLTFGVKKICFLGYQQANNSLIFERSVIPDNRNLIMVKLLLK